MYYKMTLQTLKQEIERIKQSVVIEDDYSLIIGKECLKYYLQAWKLKCEEEAEYLFDMIYGFSIPSIEKHFDELQSEIKLCEEELEKIK